MKHTSVIAFIILISAAGVAGILSGCNANSYANDLKSEKALIIEYLKRNNITIISDDPGRGNWRENDYLEIADYLYFHLIDAGDTEGDSVKSGDQINMRYLKYTLDVPADTIRYWTTNDAPTPITFTYGQSAYTGSSYCSAWQYAIGYMKFSNSTAKIICPSKLGFDEEQETVTPYGYDLKIQIVKY